MDWMLMPLRRYADFSGRSRRMEYWMFVLFQIIIYFAVMMLMMLVGGAALMSGDPNALAGAGIGAMIIGLLYLVVTLGLFIPSLAVGVRRLHDTNRTGWWIVAPLAPYLLVIVAGMLAVSSPDMAAVAGILGLVAMLGVFALGITVFVFLVLEGTKGPNQYGPDPKGQDSGQVFA